ncbi:MAG: hypothetical protein Q4D13_01390 [Erysipelotrichaceae bacterium]|nr:hypothetical protein [Erysipelotrichaceae bacterium]
MIFGGLIIFISLLIGTPYLGGLNSYRNRIVVPEAGTISEMSEFSDKQVQVIDKEVSKSLADRVFGEMGAQIVSQYQMPDIYNQCVVNNVMYRLTPVEFSGFIKWMSTRSNGTPGFISVDVSDGTTVFHKVDEGLTFTNNAYFLANLNLHVRLQYPAKILGEVKFEVDDSWNPYWVTKCLKYSFISKAVDVEGVIITSPIDGKSNYYPVGEIPSWVDNVYGPSMVCEQYNSYSQYRYGLFNFAQKGITSTTDDYAYLQKDGHLWIYTGVTSVGSDESNVGYMYIDLQNKDVIYIESAGAEEYSARASAEGAVQEKGYQALFPTMVNIQGEEVYFMGLKDNAGLIKEYAFVSYKNYQKVGTGKSIQEALINFSGKNIVTSQATDIKEITVNDIESAVVDGYTIYYIQTIENEIYTCSIEISDRLPFIKPLDVLKVTVSDNMIISIE